MFYENYERLCNETGEKPYALAVQLGAKNNSVVAQWMKGSVPRKAMLEKIADHFGITVSELMYGKEKQPTVIGELSKYELELIAAFRALPADEKQHVLALLRLAAGRDQKDPASAEE